MKEKVRTFLIFWLPVLVWTALIFFLSSKPGLRVATGVWDFLTRKPAHILEYFILAFLLVRALKFGIPKKYENFSILTLSFLLSVLYAGSDEFHQTFVPLREGRISDILFDSFGSLVGVFVAWRLFQNHQSKPEK